MATGVMVFPNLYHWRLCNLTLARDRKRATRVKTTTGWHMNRARWFSRDNLSFLKSVGGIGGGDNSD